jgi:hypothetical protein
MNPTVHMRGRAMSFETLRSRGFIAQTLIDFATLCAWALLGVLGLMVVGSPIVFLAVLLFTS